MTDEFVVRVGRHQVLFLRPPPNVGGPGKEEYLMRHLALTERRAAFEVLQLKSGVGGKELKFARKALGLTKSQLAVLLGVKVDTITGWEAGTAEKWELGRLVQLAYLALFTRIGDKGVEPLDVIPEKGDPIYVAEQVVPIEDVAPEELKKVRGLEAIFIHEHDITIVAQEFGEVDWEALIAVEDVLQDGYGENFEFHFRVHQGRGVDTVCQGLKRIL